MIALQYDVHSNRTAHFTVPERVAQKYRKKEVSLRVLPPHINGAIKLPLTPNNVKMKAVKGVGAGLTYFGQIISHDLTFMLRQRRCFSATLELRTLYGDTNVMPLVFLRTMANIGADEAPMLADSILENAKFRYREREGHIDFIRSHDDKAILMDERNDDNFIIGQLLLAIMRFHNKICDHLSSKKAYYSSESLFLAAKRTVVCYYRWAVVNQYLKVIVHDPALVDQLLNSDKAFKIMKSKRPAIIMPEFIDASFRIGHSQVQNAYRLSEEARTFKIFGPNIEACLNGQVDRIQYPIVLHWPFLFEMDDKTPVQQMAAFDPSFTIAFSDIPNHPNLIELDISRNAHYGLEYAEKIGVKVLQQADLDEFVAKHTDVKLVDLPNLPLGIYLLFEAHKFESGQHLGPLGSQIIAEQVLWAAGDLVPPDLEMIAQLMNQPPSGEAYIQDLLRCVDESLHAPYNAPQFSSL